MTAVVLSQHVYLSQPSISRLENGKSGLPDWETVLKILKALDCRDDQVETIRRQFQLAQLDPRSFIAMRTNGLDEEQLRMLNVEASARRIRDFQNSVIPGLLQTPQYATAIFEKLGLDVERAKSAAVVRSQRQAILSDPNRTFAFVILDAALYSTHNLSREDQGWQLNQVLARAHARNVEVRILDAKKGVPLSMANPFCIIDRRFVSAETTMKEISTTNQNEVLEYEHAFSELVERSLSAKDSIDYIRSVEGEMNQSREL